jgi:dihydrofolate reductase
MNPNQLSAIIAIASNGVIGRNNTLPWKLRADLQRFKRLTMGHWLIMGRKTFESIGKPLPGRQTIVLSRQTDLPLEGVQVVSSLEAAMKIIPDQDQAFVVGGAQIYQLAMPSIRQFYVTEVLAEIDGDASLSPLDLSHFQCIEQAYVPSDAWNEWPTHFKHFVRRD